MAKRGGLECPKRNANGLPVRQQKHGGPSALTNKLMDAATITPRLQQERPSGVPCSGLLERRARKRERNRLWMARWRKENAEIARQRGRDWDAKHPGANALQLREYYQRHKETHMGKVKAWQSENRARVRGYTRKSMARHAAELTDYYVRAKLSRGTRLKPAAWPEALVRLKRAELKLKRLWLTPKVSKTSTN